MVYIGIYLFMNLAAFAIVAFLRNAIGSEEIADYAGLVRRSPGLTVCMAIVMFSLVGLPPLAGFQAKMVIFYALVQAEALDAACSIGVLNTVLSLFYYLRVVRVMVFSPEPLYRDAPTIPLPRWPARTARLLTLPVVVLFFMMGGLLELGQGGRLHPVLLSHDTMKAFEAILLGAQPAAAYPLPLAAGVPGRREALGAVRARQVRAALDRLVADQRLYARRVAEAIIQLRRAARSRPLPPEFAAKNDLSLEFLLREVIDYQEQDVAPIEHCAAQLEGEPALHALAEEILGNTKGHLDILKEMMKDE